ncbi:hypothetical protein HQ590_03060 [bacterium]|nr:hypothetical protein [bacterium]
MKLKPVITTALLAFLAVSVVALIFKETRPAPAAGPGAVPPARTAGATVVAYYFHGTQRCPTCRSIERQAKQAIATGFADDLETGRLVFQPVNIEDPAHQHFVTDFQLETRSVVLADYRDGRPQRWQELVQVWTLVRDEPAFEKYVTDELRQFLAETP